MKSRLSASFMSKTGLILSFLLTSLLLTSCWDRVEINDLAIILATGIDVREDHKVHLSVQIFIPRQSGGSVAGSSGNPSAVTMVQSADGDNIAEAMIRLQRKLSRNVFWGHCEAIIIGQHAASKGIRQYLDFLLRFSQIREHAYVYVSEQRAVESLALLPPLERSSAEVLREMGNMKLGTKVTVLSLAESIEGINQSAVLSRLKIIPAEYGQGKYATMPYIRGLALFKNDRYLRSLAEPSSIGMLILLNQLEQIVFTVYLGDNKQYVSIKPSDIRTELTPQIVNGKWIMHISVKMKGDVVLNTTNFSMLDPKKLKAIEEKWSKLVTEIIDPVLRLSQKELKTDFFGYGVEYRRHFPKQWNKMKSTWNERYPDVISKLNIETRLYRTGKSNNPQGIPDQAIKRK